MKKRNKEHEEDMRKKQKKMSVKLAHAKEDRRKDTCKNILLTRYQMENLKERAKSSVVKNNLYNSGRNLKQANNGQLHSYESEHRGDTKTICHIFLEEQN
jgi:hypothetical protein